MNAHLERTDSRSLRHTVLMAIELLVGLMAVPCGLLLVVNGLGMPEELLADSPFESFVVPGLVLTFVVGLSKLGAAWLVWRGDDRRGLASLAAGCILLGWIVVETLLIHDGRVLQAAIAFAALAIIALALPDVAREVRGADPRAGR